MNFVSGEAVAYAMLQFLWSQGTKDWGWKRAVECLLHHWIADSEGTWLCKDILFLFVPSRPFVNPDGPDPSPPCAKMTNTVCPATPVFYTWPSVFLLSLDIPLLFLKVFSLAFGMGQLYQRRIPSLYRYRTATFHHLKITWMTGELLSQAFLQKESFQKHLDSVILSWCPLSSLSFLHLVLVFIDGKFFGVGTVFLGSCNICCHGILSLDYMPWKLRKKLVWPNPVLVGLTM